MSALRLSLLSRVFASIVLLLAAASAFAGGPRFVAGTNFAATGPGAILGWYGSQPTYFTDPGSLSSTVSHAQADAMVAAAAAVWNVPTASVVLTQGGNLGEHISGANTYFDGVNIVFPEDVESTNAVAMPVAVIYDSDGSITDLLLGSGASQPSECNWNGVTESVDSFGPGNTINHAVIVINGRCIATLPQSLTQLQYQLTRVFGRILGLAWSQTNDNVFTGSPTPTAQQMAYWPVMHPMDVLCGLYTYQCMTNPFTLRPDDLSSLAGLYPVNSGNLTPGKSLSLANAVEIRMMPYFPTGQGMELINVTVTLRLAGHSESQTWETTSGVSGVQFQANGGNPVTGPESAADNVGRNYPDQESFFIMGMVPVGPSDADLFLTTESINPLYTGDYALGPYQRPPITLSGPQQTFFAAAALPNQVDDFIPAYMTGAAATCSPGNDGNPGSPAPADPSGWWSGQLCAVGHVSWGGANIKAGHTWTVETTAVDENGYATSYKAQPVIGVWNVSDPTYVLPTIAAAGTAMNALVLGMTQLHVPAASTDSSVQIAIADQFGAVRPDFSYNARLLYADSVSPSTVGAGGGQITITGTGFRDGNVVTVNGVRATVFSWSATQIVALAPTLAAVGNPSSSVDVIVTDATTNGSTDMPAVLTYNASAPPVQSAVILNPVAYIAAGASASWAISLTAMQNGLPAANIPVLWSSSSLTPRPAQSMTGANGIAAVTVSSSSIPAQTNTVTGCIWTSICATWSVIGVDPSQWQLNISSGAGQSIAYTSTPAPVVLIVTDSIGHPLPGATVSVYQTVDAWEGSCPVVGRCPAAPVIASSKTSATSDVNGQVTITPLTVAGVPQVINIAASAGTQGFISLALTLTP